MKARKEMPRKRKVFHVVHKKDHWTLKEERKARTTGSFGTKKDAIMKGRKLVQPFGKLVVHKKNNVIQIEYTYGKDPVRTKG